MHRPYQATTLNYKIPERNHEASGEIIKGRLSERARFGEIFHAVSTGNFAGEKYAKALSTDAISLPNTVMALEDLPANEDCYFLVRGWVRNDSWSWSVDAELYQSATAGALTSVQPEDSKILARALKSNLVWYEPRVGSTGASGASTYFYIAYASDSSGTDFSLTPADNLQYVAYLNTTTEITSPEVSDFAGLWRLTGVEVGPVAITLDSSGDTDPLDPYSLVWTDSVLRVVHAYGIDHLPNRTIKDNNGERFDPPKETWIDSNTIDIDFGPIVPIKGEWTLMLSTGGVGQRGPTGPDGTITAEGLATIIHAATSKETPVDADELGLIDSEAANALKKITWANQKAALKTYFDTLYASGGLTTYADLTDLEASTAESDADLVWCTSLASLYQRLDAGSAYTRDGTFVCNTGSGGNTRFIAKGGAYTYAEANFKSVIMAISSPLPTDAITAGRAITSDDFGKILPVSSSSVQTMTFPSMGAADHGKGFKIAQMGTAGVQCDRSDSDTITDKTKTSIRTNEQFKIYTFTYYHPDTMWLMDNGGDWITTP